MTWRRQRAVSESAGSGYETDHRSREILGQSAADLDAVHADMSRVVRRLESDVEEADQ